METLRQRKAEPVLAPGFIKGRWRLNYKITNNNGIAGFGGKLLAPYPDPITGRTRQLYDMNGNETLGFYIGTPVVDLDPENNPQDANAIDWLAGHPEVGIQNDQVRMDGKFVARKQSNPRATLVNLDHQNVVDLDEEDYIDRLVGIITLETGKQALGLDKLRFILAKMNLTYREERFITNREIEKKKLRKRLKDFIRKDMENAKAFETILDNLTNAQFIYELKEMLRLEILTQNNGMYMYNGNPLGISFEQIMKYFDNNQDFYVELQGKLLELQRKEVSYNS